MKQGPHRLGCALRPPAPGRGLVVFLVVSILCTFSRASPSLSAELAFGLAAGDHTGLSLQKKADRHLPAWHISAFFQSQEFLQLNTDLQYYLNPGVLSHRVLQGSLYSGVGMRVVSLPYRSREEDYWLRFPVGILAEGVLMRLQGFLEISGLVGPLPSTKLKVSTVAGLRVSL